MATDTETPSSRRALLAVVGGAAAAFATHALRPLAARAEDESIQVGGEYTTAQSVTSIRNQTNAEDVFYARTDSSGVAIRGVSASGWGVFGQSGDRGVFGLSETGSGVVGTSGSGTGVVAASDSIGLRVVGRIVIDQVSGVATIPAGSRSRTVDPGVSIVAASRVLLTPMANLGSRALWVTMNASADTFTIRLGSSRSSSTKIAWLLVG